MNRDELRLDGRSVLVTVEADPSRRLHIPASPADGLRAFRARVLDQPNLLMAIAEPPIDALWGYVKGLTHAIELLEGRDGRSWGAFLKARNFGMRTEHNMLHERHATFDARVRFLRTLFEDYEAFVEEARR